jgi:hypothetical protein
MEITKLTKLGVKNKECSMHDLPILPKNHMPMNFPYCKQVHHLKGGEYHKFQKRCYGKTFNNDSIIT